MPIHPKRNPPSGRLPFDDGEEPTPQHAAEYPSGPRRMPKKHEEAIPTTVYNTEKFDEELPQSWDPALVNDGFKPSFLYVERGPGAGQLVQIKQGPLVMGRASISDLRMQHSSISRRHAQITRAEERFYVKDLGSQNGTFVNKIKIATEIEIYPGDQIAVGNALVKLRGPLQQAQAPASAKGEIKAKVKGKASQSKVLTATTPRRGRPSVAKVALFAGAVGFGLAGAVMFAVLNVPQGEPSFQPIAGAPRPEAKLPMPAVVPAAGDDQARRVDERVREAMQERRAMPVATPAEVEVEVEATPVGGEARAAAVAGAKKKVVSAAKVAPPAEEPAAAASPKRAVILARYEEGDAAGSLEAAKRAGDKDLVAKLTRFQAEYDAAGSAIAAKNGSAAIKHFDAALKLDEQLSSGWGKYGTEIRKQLSGLWTLVGFAHLENDNQDAARKAFNAALRHEPDNSRAKAQLEKLGAAQKPAAPKQQIDDAFAEEVPAAAAPTAAPAPSRSSAIDDAFGD